MLAKTARAIETTPQSPDYAPIVDLVVEDDIGPGLALPVGPSPRKKKNGK